MAETDSILDPLFKELADGIAMADGEGHILYINPAAERILEVPQQKAVGQSLCELLCGHLMLPVSNECAAARCPIREHTDDQKAVTYQGRYGPKMSFEWRQPSVHRVERWKNLRVRAMRIATPWLDSWDPEKCLVIMEDVSAEADLERQKEDWRKMIAHDLRNPLTSVYGNLRLLQEVRRGRVPEASEERLVEISLRSCGRMLELINLYLDISKLGAGLMPVEPSRFDIRPLVDECVEEQSSLARERRIEVAVAVPSPHEVVADRGLLTRVAQNLLSNALKYTPEGGRVVLSASREKDGRTIFSVKDTGFGIPPEELPHLFDPYYQGKARRAGKIEGTGLGLTFCREALKAMNGDIRVESKPGQGSTFIATLPAAPEGGKP